MLRLLNNCLSHTFTPLNFNHNKATKPCPLWTSLFSYSLLKLVYATCSGLALSAELFEALCSIVGKCLYRTNMWSQKRKRALKSKRLICRRSQHSLKASIFQCAKEGRIQWSQQPSWLQHLKSHAILLWKHRNLPPQHLNLVLPVENTLTCTPFLCHIHFLLQYFFVFKCFIGGFSHQVSARCLTIQLISNYFYVEVMAVKQLDEPPSIALCTISNVLEDLNCPIENSIQGITLLCITGTIELPRLWLVDRQVLSILSFCTALHSYTYELPSPHMHYDLRTSHGSWLCNTAG